LKLLPLVQKAQQGRNSFGFMMHLLGRIQPENFNADQVKKYNGVLSYAIVN
jgi:hypothetical protein